MKGPAFCCFVYGFGQPGCSSVLQCGRGGSRRSAEPQPGAQDGRCVCCKAAPAQCREWAGGWGTLQRAALNYLLLLHLSVGGLLLPSCLNPYCFLWWERKESLFTGSPWKVSTWGGAGADEVQRRASLISASFPLFLYWLGQGHVSEHFEHDVSTPSLLPKPSFPCNLDC